jgi:hypothetical protein
MAPTFSNKRNILCFISTVALLLNSCSPKYTPYTGEKSFRSPSGQPDYLNLDYWAAHPDKWDPSDSIPSPLKGTVAEKKVDVFFLYPTSFTNEKDSAFANANIDDSLINKKTDYTSILYQASVFNASCNVYAPRYRQAHLQMYYTKDTIKAKEAFELAYQDIKKAFIYYLETKNHGRPIIIASHSQGTTHAKRLLKEFFDGKPLSKQLVAAYILGIPVEKSFFSSLAICKDTLSTACFISWRTYREGYEKGVISSKDSGIAVINPMLWSEDRIHADRIMHKGAILYNFNKVYTHTQASQIAGNVLWISKPRFPGGFFYFTKNYHAGDFNLFYMDIQTAIMIRPETDVGHN